MAPKRKADADGGAGGAGGSAPVVVSKSPAEFFANNKTIAGFDNPGKSLYTTIREFVENSLDAAESIRVLPDIYITLEEISQARFNQLFGVETIERKNVALYRDHDAPKEKKAKKMAPAADEAATADASAATPVTPVTPATPQQAESSKRSGTLYYRVTVRDNGCGMPHADIPQLMGRVLSGTKYSVKQQRGRFGLGAKMALIWSQMSTGCPITVRSTQKNGGPTSLCRLHIDIAKNIPAVLEHRLIPAGTDGADGTRGTEVSVVIEGNFMTYRAKVLNYMRQLAVITPYGHFEFRFIAESENRSFAIRYARRSDQIPPPPRSVSHHPSSVNLLLMRSLIDESAAKGHSLEKHLTTQYSGIDKTKAHLIIDELGEGFSPSMPVSELRDEQIHRILQLFKEMKFQPPDGSCLSPVGEYNLRLGIMKEIKADMIATYQEKTRVYEGHPFIVEAAVSLGGKSVDVGLNIYRFANRIPLLFESGADVVTRQASKKINWPMYRIKPTTDRIGVFVSIVSTKIPFKGTGKEYIGDDIDEIASAVKHAIQQCCLQLKVRLARMSHLKLQRERKQMLLQYIPSVSKSLFSVADAIVQRKDGAFSERYGALLRRIASRDLSDATLARHLTLFVERHADAIENAEEGADGTASSASSVPSAGDEVALRLVPWKEGQEVKECAIGSMRIAFLPQAIA